jgi:CrcB protein
MGGAFPIATLLVNVVGCVVIGAVMGVISLRPAESIDPAVRAGVTAGLLGGLTTFSAFGYESFTLLREGRAGMALIVIGLNVGVGLVGVAMGWYGARWLVG